MDRSNAVTLPLFTAFTLCIAACGCSKSDRPGAAKSEAPAKVEAHPDEKDIYRLVLTPKAEQRLQISTAPVEMRAMPRFRSLGGDMAIPDGRRIPVNAPMTGTLLRAGDIPVPAPGQRVTANQVLMKMALMLPPEREVPNAAERVQMANAQATLASTQIQADGDVNQSAAQVDAAEIALARSRKLLNDGAGSRRQVDEAEAALNIAQKGLEAAQERKVLLARLSTEAKTGVAPVISIPAPRDGIIQTVSTSTGQVVNAGTLLFEIVDLDRLWVKVPVYAGLADEIDSTKDASVHALSRSGDSVAATPIEAPPTANAMATSVDVYYAVDNSDSRFRPGERVVIQVPLKGESNSLVLPRAAILRDIYGTAWVYVNSGPQEFRRERVAVRFSTARDAVLSMGPDVGTPVVVDGAAELFGTEFGAGK